MLAKVGNKEIFKLNGFIFEPKLDGTRVLIYKKNNDIKLINRRDRDITYRYPELLCIWKNIKAKECVLDAELVVLNKKGLPDFNLLQQREQLENKTFIELRSKQLPATLFVFDVLELEGKSLLEKPLQERKKVLQNLITASPFIVLCPWTKNGKILWQQALKMGLEGVMAKKIGSCYEQKRSEAWLKIKKFNTIDTIIVGFLPGKGTRKNTFSALLLAVYHKDRKKFIYVGKVGTGFDQTTLEKLTKLMKKLKTDKPILENQYKYKNVTWIKPELVAEIKFLELTKNKELRAPSFLRLRFDKKPQECSLEPF